MPSAVHKESKIGGKCKNNRIKKGKKVERFTISYHILTCVAIQNL
jgi:hypothetical protein